MLRILIILLISLSSFCTSQVVSKLSDGPFVFIEHDRLVEKSIYNDELEIDYLDKSAYDTIYKPGKSNFYNVKRIAALSDIHGQYDLFVKLLTKNNIIDDNQNWNFGDGHLVIVGDIFDRGDKVNDIIWLVYKLEIQARNSGGFLHYLLGNHEFMVLQKDLRYLNNHHIKIADFLGLDYDQLYGDNTIIGRWLRSKNTIIKINNIVFTHGGISEEFINENGTDFVKINIKMRENIDFERKKMRSTDIHEYYYGKNNLTWHRGYFEKYFKNYKEDFSIKDVNKILKLLNANHIVVGHTSQDKIVELFNNKIFAVDSSIKRGEYGELLLFDNYKFYRATITGDLIPISK